MRRVQVPRNGQMVEGEEVDFTVEREDWNVYQCEDGTKARVKLIAHKIVRIIGQRGADGEPVYFVTSSNVIVTHAQPHLLQAGS